MAALQDQLRQIFRRLRRTPLFTTITLVTLAIGIGANTVIFSVLEGILLKPLPYPHSEKLIGVWQTAPGVGIKDLNMAAFLYFIIREQGNAFEDVGLYTGDSLSATGTGQPERLRGLDVTDGTLPLLGVRPALGRLFTRGDDSDGHPQTVLLTDPYWRKRFGASPSVIGSSITLDGRPREIIGVLPRGFHFLDGEDPEVIVPMQLNRANTKLGGFNYRGVARLKPGVTMAQASADMARLYPIAIHSFPAPEGFSAKIFETVGLAPNLRTLKQDVVGDVGNVLWVLMGSIAMVLLVACANVANLLLVRVEGRRQELAIRAALGAGWSRVATDLIAESVILGLVSSLFGLALAYGALRLLVALAPTGLPRLHEITINLPVLLFTLAISLFSSLLIGAIPVLKYAGARINSSLREGGRTQSQTREQHRARSALVVVQVALALVLLICSGLMIRTFRALTQVSPGFTSPDTLQTFSFSIPESQVPDSQRERLLRMQHSVAQKLAALPGVTSVGLSTDIPMSGQSSNDPVFAQDKSYKDGDLPPIRRFKFTSPGFFSTIGTRILLGRDFTWDDNYQRLPVAIISENFAKEYWGSAANALGKRIRVGTGDDWREIVGVVADTYDDGVSQPAPTSVYWPMMLDRFEGEKERSQRWTSVAIRTPRAGSQAFIKEVQQVVWSVDPDLPLADIHTVGYYYTRSMARTSFTLVMLMVAGSMALLLGVVGIYGVISYSVSQRTREIGIRMALGAQRNSITAMFVRHGLLLTAIGIVFGLVSAFATMRLMSSLLFNVSPVDPITYISITAAVIVTSWLACYLPSRRASAVNPVNALRSE